MLSVSYLVEKCCLTFGTRVKGMYLGNELSTLKFKSFCTRLNDKMLARTKSSIYRVSQIREFQIQSVVGDHFSSPNMEIKKNRDSPHKDTVADKKK
jgi:hypothetical protein